MAPAGLMRVCGTACLLFASGCVAPSGNSLGSGFVPPSDAASLTEAVKDIQDPAKLYLAYAKWQEDVGNLVKARESYEFALGEDPQSMDAILGLARIDQLAGRKYKAEQRFLKALQMKPSDPNVLNTVGQFYATEERWDEARQMLRAAMQADPEHPKYRFDLAVALANSGDIESAMPHFVQTVGDAEAYYNIGYILYKRGELAAAERQLLQAVVTKPQLAEAHAMLDEVRRKQSDRTMLAGAQNDNPAAASQMPGTSHSWPVSQASRQTSADSQAARNSKPMAASFPPSQQGRGWHSVETFVAETPSSHTPNTTAREDTASSVFAPAEWPKQQSADISPSSYGYPPRTDATLSAAQREQLQNQTKTETQVRR